MRYPPSLEKLITLLKKIPGVGAKSAERYAFQIIHWPDKTRQELGALISNIKNSLHNCPECAALIEEIECPFCSDKEREKENYCIVASFKDVFTIEMTGYKGPYHVLGSLLSPLEGKKLHNDTLKKSRKRINKFGITELVIALDPTLEGDATALYLKESSLPWASQQHA